MRFQIVEGKEATSVLRSFDDGLGHRTSVETFLAFFGEGPERPGEIWILDKLSRVGTSIAIRS